MDAYRTLMVRAWDYIHSLHFATLVFHTEGIEYNEMLIWTTSMHLQPGSVSKPLSLVRVLPSQSLGRHC